AARDVPLPYGPVHIPGEHALSIHGEEHRDDRLVGPTQALGLPALEVIDPDNLVRPPYREPLSLRGAGYPIGVRMFGDDSLVTGPEFPEPDGGVLAGRGEPILVDEDDVDDLLRVSRKDPLGRPARRVPDPDRPILAGGGEQPPARRKVGVP